MTKIAFAVVALLTACGDDDLREEPIPEPMDMAPEDEQRVEIEDEDPVNLEEPITGTDPTADPNPATATATDPATDPATATATATDPPTATAPAPTTATVTGSAPTMGSAGGITVTELILATGVENREPVDPKMTFSRSTDSRIYTMIRLNNAERAETEIQMAWVARGAALPSDRVTRLSVPAMPRYRTWAFTGTRRPPGSYDAIIATTDGQEIGRAPFEIVP